MHGGGQTRHAWAGTGAELASAGWYAMSVDMRGAWQNDAEVEGDIGMGELIVWVPDDVFVDVENMTQVIGAATVADRSMLEELDEGAPTLRLDLSGGMGSIEVRRH